MPTSASAPAPRIAALVLAAGRSTRMGHFKLLADLGGKPMLRRVVEAVCAAPVAPVVVVTGHEAEAVQVALCGLAVSFVHNPRYAEGLATSLAAGISALPDDVDGVVVVLGDMPQIAPATLAALVQAFTSGHVVVPVQGGEMGNPILWPREAFARMASLTGDAGARRLLPAFDGRIRRVEVSEGDIFADVDTPEALAAIRGRIDSAS